MKLLGWMHSKFRQSNRDVFKDHSTGSTCNCLTSIVSKEDNKFSPVQEQGMLNNDGLSFEGLLSIGTLGSPIVHENDMTEYLEYESKYALSAIVEKEEDEMDTEMELKLVNEELEKALTEAAEKEGDRISSARPSHFNEACPLQEFLLGAAVMDVGAEKEKKEKRASLVELFMIEEGKENGHGLKKEEKKEGKKGKKMAKKLMKKIIDGDGAGAGAGAGKDNGKDNGSFKTAKFSKILKLFHKKIHPENDTTRSNKHAKSTKYKGKCANATAHCGNSCLVKDSSKNSSNLFCSGCSVFSADGSDSSDSSEHWINTDADFLVLEIQKGISLAD